MKAQLFKKLTALVLAVLTVVSLFSCGGNKPAQEQYPENGARKIVNDNVKLYASPEEVDELPIAYYENESEILLIEIKEAFVKLFNEFALTITGGKEADIKETDTGITVTRENGAYCEIDFVKDTVFFNDFDSFVMSGSAENPLDLLAWSYLDDDGESVYIKRESSVYTPGYGIEIDLGQREIPLDIYKGKKYIPVQTFNDLFISAFGVNVAYNGKDLFALIGSTLTPEMQELYYSGERKLRSEALAKFNYNELCLYLDLHYGLQSEHGFNDGFDYYLENVGLRDELLKLDAINSFNAIGTLTLGYIADLHSAVLGASPYLGVNKPNANEINYMIGNDMYAALAASEKYNKAREEALGEVKIYEKIGNTAYVTFDSFTLGSREQGYTEEALQVEDTLAIIMSAHAQISQDDEIENVVLDLSCNEGGAFDAAVYVIAWMLGSCDISIYNSVTESRATTNYVIDANMDGKFDENDTIADKNLYCIISPVSFSCGNLVPASLKASGKVTILGKTSGGGGCSVRPAVTADGTFFCISSNNQISTVKNGSYYGVDTGVVPDITLTKLASFYDREALTEYINDLK